MNKVPALLDSRFEDPTRLSRRGLFRTLFAASTVAASSIPFSQLQAADSQIVTAPDDEDYWRWIAAQFLIKPGVAYMNTGTRGPSPTSVYRAQIEALTAANTDRLSYARHVYNADYKKYLRTRLASFLGCNDNEVALTNNTTEGMVVGTLGVDMKRGDEIIYTNHDHSSGAQPINLRAARYGTVPVMVDLSSPSLHPASSPQLIVDTIEKAVTRRTRLISICHINYTDGCVMPVKEICEMARAKGILTLVDGAHPPGMLDLNLHELGCDMYAGACHKWMMAGMLTGFFYVREELLDRVWPTMYSGPVAGKNMYGAIDDSERANTAEKFEVHGSNNYAAGVSVHAALDFQEKITKPAIESRDRYLAEVTRAGLENIDGVEVFSSTDQRLCAGLVSFRVKGVDTKILSDLLWDRHQIYIRNVTHKEINWDANRASLHLMVTRSDVDNLIDAVREIAASPPPPTSAIS